MVQGLGSGEESGKSKLVVNTSMLEHNKGFFDRRKEVLSYILKKESLLNATQLPVLIRQRIHALNPPPLASHPRSREKYILRIQLALQL